MKLNQMNAMFQTEVIYILNNVHGVHGLQYILYEKPVEIKLKLSLFKTLEA